MPMQLLFSLLVINIAWRQGPILLESNGKWVNFGDHGIGDKSSNLIVFHFALISFGKAWNDLFPNPKIEKRELFNVDKAACQR